MALVKKLKRSSLWNLDDRIAESIISEVIKLNRVFAGPGSENALRTERVSGNTL